MLSQVWDRLDDLISANSPFQLPSWKWVRLALFVACDILVVSLSYLLAFVLRLDDWSLGSYHQFALKSLPLVVAIHLVFFSVLGLYRQVWRYANIYTAVLVAKSVLLSTTLYVVISFFVDFDKMPPRSLPAIYCIVAVMALTMVRFSWRMLTQYRKSLLSQGTNRCLIYGAGSAGELLARHIEANPKFPFHAVGFIDDDRNQQRRSIHGLKIVGTGQELTRLAKELEISTVLIALHNAPGAVVRSLVAKCQEASVRPLIMPDLATSLSDDVCQPRPIDVKDLLRRAPKAIERQLISEWFAGQSVLVTGAGGSIGSEICRQVVMFNPKRLIMLDVCEFNLYRIEMELRDLRLKEIELIAILGSVTEQRVVHRIMKMHQPTSVLHAAAYKHVPLVEHSPVEGIINNVVGTKVLVEASLALGVKNFLLVSTDKAVRPTNIMGASKRCCEIIVQAMQERSLGQCKFSAVRFGNVLGSSGSVIPRFIEQIQSGRPVTVTHPEMTRYFMLASEAVALVLQSISVANGGEIFVLNMGKPVKILDMAKQLIMLAGKVPGIDVEIIITGARPGEKLYEELILEGCEQKTTHDDVFIATPRHSRGQILLNEVKGLIEAAYKDDEAECRRILKSIIDADSVTVPEPIRTCDLIGVSPTFINASVPMAIN